MRRSLPAAPDLRLQINIGDCRPGDDHPHGQCQWQEGQSYHIWPSETIPSRHPMPNPEFLQHHVHLCHLHSSEY
uniref:Uncharacterized protein n=1 Tax=Panagrellus redivivus TaxID=6233 RepID=A0A7E4UVB4_PANRE